MLRRLLRALGLGPLLALAACAPTRPFFPANRYLYYSPVALKIPFEEVVFLAEDGTKLHAMLFPARGTPQGTIVYFHGNFANLTNHFPQALFLVRAGFDVFAFDYRGYGKSEGEPSPAGVIQDGVDAIRYAAGNPRTPGRPVGVFAQSLGAATAAVAAAREPLAAAVVLESGFNSYRSMARAVTLRSPLLWPLYPIYPLLLPGAYDAEDAVAKIAPRPVLFLHGSADRTVPAWMSRRLFTRAKEPKRLIEFSGAGHLGLRRQDPQGYDAAVVGFFEEHLVQKK